MMEVHGDIAFAIYDDYFEAELGCMFNDIVFDKVTVVKKGDRIFGKRIAPKNALVCMFYFENSESEKNAFDNATEFLVKKKKTIIELMKKYKDVRITIHLRSDCYNIGLSIPSEFLKALAKIIINLELDILSFGLAEP